MRALPHPRTRGYLIGVQSWRADFSLSPAALASSSRAASATSATN
jgi:hypothetical protein